MGLFDGKREKDQYDARLSQVLGRPVGLNPPPEPPAAARSDASAEVPGPGARAGLPPVAPAAVLAAGTTLASPPAAAANDAARPDLPTVLPPLVPGRIAPPFQPVHLGTSGAGTRSEHARGPLDGMVQVPSVAMAPPRVPAPAPGATLMRLGYEPGAPPRPPSSAVLFFPAAPESLDDTGLTAPFVQDHILRTLYFSQQLTGGQIAEAIALPFMQVASGQLEALRKDQFVEVLRQRGIGDAGYVYGLTSRGTARALEALSKTQYHDALPVPLDRYIAGVKAQTIRQVVVTEENIRQAFSDLIIRDGILDQVGPAVNSASAMFLFGSPGNGKTSIAERITRLMGDAIYIPYAVEVDGYVVKLMDFLVHEPVGEVAAGQDARWMRIRRPTVVAGGELTMATLDLLWSDVGKFYEAPLQMKANGGMFLIDDFGRQAMRPQDLLNRWIVPLEKRLDYLTLVTGKKIQIPFDQLITFSTNLDPRDLVDDAFLRRIKFKIDVKDPTKEHFIEIMEAMCRARNVPYQAGGLEYMLDKWWLPFGRPLRMCQPRDILDQMIAIARYKQVQPSMASADLIDRACATYFVSTESPPTATPRR